jgi:hypothetical protein
MGSHEDIVTAALSTAFCYCPNFTEKFFSKIGFRTYKWKDTKDEYDYLVDTGYEINGNYSWLKRGIKFRPDILISKKEKWDKKSPPRGEQLIVIESKIWARLEHKQEKQYHLFKQEYLKRVNKNIKTLLITLKEDNTREYFGFDKNITWNDLIKISEEIYKNIPEWNSESVLLRELIDFLKIRLLPDEEDFKNEQDQYCPKDILKRIKSRTCSNSYRVLDTYKMNENDMVCKPYSDLLALHNLKDDDLMSAFKLTNEKGERYICCAVKGKLAIFWVADYFDKKQDCKKIGTLKLNPSVWLNDWFDIMTKIYRLINR